MPAFLVCFFSPGCHGKNSGIPTVRPNLETVYDYIRIARFHYDACSYVKYQTSLSPSVHGYGVYHRHKAHRFANTIHIDRAREIDRCSRVEIHHVTRIGLVGQVARFEASNLTWQRCSAFYTASCSPVWAVNLCR